MQFWKTEKLFFFLSKVVLLHQTIIKEWLMFRWKILAHIYLDPLFVKLKEKSLTPTFILTLTFIRQLRVCKMIIALGAFFHFLKNFIFWAKNRVKEQKWSKIGKKLVRTLSEEQHVIWLWFLVFLVRLSHFFHFSKILILGQKWPRITCNAVGIIFKELYINWLWFLGCRRKMVVYQGFFFLFLKNF